MVVLKGRKGPRGRQRRRFDSRTVWRSRWCASRAGCFLEDVGSLVGRRPGDARRGRERWAKKDTTTTDTESSTERNLHSWGRGGKEEGRRGGEDYQNDLKWDENLEQNLSEKQEERKLEAREKRKQDHLLICRREVSIGYDYSRCKFREMPVETPADFFKRQVWKSFELDPRNAPLNVSLSEEAMKSLVLRQNVNDESDDAIQLTREFIERLPLVRGSRVMKMVLEGHSKRRVAEVGDSRGHSDDDLIGESFSSIGSGAVLAAAVVVVVVARTLEKNSMYKSCAVVGTSGSLKDKAPGEQIDKHEAAVNLI